jgi:periplasmic protein TonB
MRLRARALWLAALASGCQTTGAAAPKAPASTPPAAAETKRSSYWANEVYPCPSPEADEAQPLYEERDLAAPVTIAVRVAPNYPPALLKERVTGEVVLEFVVNPAGCAEPGSVRVVRTAAPGFAAAARDAALRMRFRPGRQRDGRPVRQRVTMPFTFAIED